MGENQKQLMVVSRKALGGIKKLISAYRKASVAEDKK